MDFFDMRDILGNVSSKRKFDPAGRSFVPAGVIN